MSLDTGTCFNVCVDSVDTRVDDDPEIEEIFLADAARRRIL